MATKSVTAKKGIALKTCPQCGHHTLVARGQFLVCRSCQSATWRSES